MKTLKLLLILLLIVSCSKESINETPEPIYVDHCGTIDWKRVNILNNNCNFEIRVESNFVSGSFFQVCLTESEYLELEVGDEYCYGQIQIN